MLFLIVVSYYPVGMELVFYLRLILLVFPGVPANAQSPVESYSLLDQDSITMDVDGDGRVDFVDNSLTDVHYHESKYPYLLISIDNLKGLVTDITYEPTNMIYPIGEHLQGFEGRHYMPKHHPVATRLETSDSFTGEKASVNYVYRFPYSRKGMFLGFEDVETIGFVNDIQRTKEVTYYELDKINTKFNPLVSSLEVFKDVKFCYSPEMGGSGCVPDFQKTTWITHAYDTQGLFNQYKLPTQTLLFELGDFGGETKDENGNTVFNIATTKTYDFTYNSGGDLIKKEFNN